MNQSQIFHLVPSIDENEEFGCFGSSPPGDAGHLRFLSSFALSLSAVVCPSEQQTPQ
jgi:hypothetical protein